jgi:hypothetical protein
MIDDKRQYVVRMPDAVPDLDEWMRLHTPELVGLPPNPEPSDPAWEEKMNGSQQTPLRRDGQNARGRSLRARRGT